MSLSHIPDFKLIEIINHLYQLENLLFLNELEAMEQELESRIPHFEPEYDSEGNVIVSEVIGYNEGNEIWTTSLN